jgi:hypothetical protein
MSDGPLLPTILFSALVSHLLHAHYAHTWHALASVDMAWNIPSPKVGEGFGGFNTVLDLDSKSSSFIQLNKDVDRQPPGLGISG